MKLGPNQQAWVDALRSGEYQQGEGTLERIITADDSAEETGRCYCCLGVACRVAEEAGVSIKRAEMMGGETVMQGNTLIYQDETFERLGFYSSSGDIDDAAPEERVCDLCDYISNLVEHRTEVVELIELNDCHKLTFSQIADVLEKFADLYFKEPR